MKKILVILVLSLAALTAKAQLYLGGSVTFIGAEGTGLFSFNPEVGYSITDRMAVGTSASLLLLGGDAGFSIDPYFRLYLCDLGPVRLFTDAHFTYSFAEETWGTGIRPGFAVPMSDRFSLVTHLGRIGYYDESFMVGVNSNMGNGLSYIFSPVVGVYYSF